VLFVLFSIHAALIATILDLIPNLFPFFSPGKWAQANKANLGGKMLFFDIFHDSSQSIEVNGLGEVIGSPQRIYESKSHEWIRVSLMLICNGIRKDEHRKSCMR
jgi:hypothetical protein